VKGRVRSLLEVKLRGTKDLQIMLCKSLTSTKLLVLVLIAVILVFLAESC